MPAGITRKRDCLDALIVRAAVAQIFDCVLSDHIANEVREVLQRPELGGHALGAIDAKFSPLWAVARFVEPVPDDDPGLLGAVGNDPDDVPVFATALGIYTITDLANRPKKFIVSRNTQHFKPGQKPHGIEFQDPLGFWTQIRRSGAVES